MPDLTESMMPTLDIDKHLKTLRNMRPTTDPAILAASSDRGKAVASQHAAAANAIAAMIDAYRVNGFSAGEAVFALYNDMIEPMMELPIINTSE